ncbi:DUF1269 domain-containing protein [Streptomyces parvus]
MSTLTVWKFRTADGAENVEEALKSLQKEGLIKILDAAVVSWPADRAKPRTRQLLNLVGAGALSGTFWGMLFGLIFLMPLLGAAVGAAAGALGGKLADVGIDDDFIAEVKEKVTPGTSALFLLTMNEGPSGSARNCRVTAPNSSTAISTPSARRSSATSSVTRRPDFRTPPLLDWTDRP